MTERDPATQRFVSMDPATRFWAKVRLPISGEGCWEWRGKHDRHGYGILDTGPGGSRRHERAHRISWQIHRGAIPDGLLVLHHCDHPPCVNPDHLHLGTPADNSREMRERGRSCKGEALRERMRGRVPSGDRHASRTHPETVPRGERNGQSKLTWARVDEIRTRYAQGDISQRALAAEYGINQGTLWPLLRGKTWREYDK